MTSQNVTPTTNWKLHQSAGTSQVELLFELRFEPRESSASQAFTITLPRQHTAEIGNNESIRVGAHGDSGGEQETQKDV